MLKKIAILTAAAGMLSTSMAVLAEGPTVHGQITFGFTSISGDKDSEDSQRLEDKAGSRLGVSGSNDLGNGMSVDYLLEYGAGETLKLRHSNITLKGSFGQFRLGKQTGVLYRYIGSNTDQSNAVSSAKEYYSIASNNMNSDHSLRMKNIAAYRFGAGPGGNDPITFDIQVQSVDMDEGAEGTKDNESIDSVTIGAATALGPVKLQLAYVDENSSGDHSPNLVALGFRVPLGSAEIRGHMTEVDADNEMMDDDEAWGLAVITDFGGGYSGAIGVGNYTHGGQGDLGMGDSPAEGEEASAEYKMPTHEDAGDITSAFVSLNKSFGGGLSAFAEYSTVTKTITGAVPPSTTVGANGDFTVDDDKEKTNTFVVSLIQTF